jgi:hypothetical protein
VGHAGIDWEWRKGGRCRLRLMSVTHRGRTYQTTESLGPARDLIPGIALEFLARLASSYRQLYLELVVHLGVVS